MIAAIVFLLLGSVSSTEIKVLHSSGPESCSLICTGQNKATDGKGWTDFNNGWLKIDLDMSGCGFTTAPAVVSSLQGHSDKATITVGSAVPRYVDRDSFSVVLTGWVEPNDSSTWAGLPTLQFAKDDQWVISWTATGYNC